MKLLLVDGHSLAYRAFYAMPALRNSQGQPTQAVLGIANMIFRILKEESPSHMMVFFDKGIPEFRLLAYPEYKAQREAAPEDFSSQVPLIQEFFQALNIRVVEEAGYEADDWIAAVARQAQKLEGEISILSGDLDLLQLVDEKTVVLSSRKGISQLTRYTPEEVKKRYGLLPAQLADFKALVGDASDNIRGLSGLGEKGAVKLLQEWGTLDRIFENANQLPEKMRVNLLSSRDRILTNKDLVSLREDAPMTFDPDACRMVPYDLEVVREFLERMELKSLAARLGLQRSVAVSAPEFTVVDSEERLETLVHRFEKGGQAGFCLWPPPAPFLESPFLAAVLDESERFVVSSKLVSIALGKFAAARAQRKVAAYHWKGFDLAFLEAGIKPPPWQVHDTLLTGWLINSLRTNPTVTDLAKEHLGMSVPEKGDDLPPLLASWISVLPKLAEELTAKLQALGLETLYQTIELPLVPVLASIERQGVALDVPFLESLSRELREELSRLEGEIYKEAGLIFNINSSKQLADVLYHKLLLPKGKKLKTGYSTDVGELERLASLSPVAGLLLQYRELSKLLNTYVDVLPKMVNPKTSRVHTTYVQAGTATGRLSSKDPNLQNIPIRSPYGRKIRKAFVAGRPEWRILAADYSQIELRLLAHFSGDSGLRMAFERGEDIHARTASEIFGAAPERITPEMRRMAKVVNFGIVYGMTEHGLSQSLGMKREEAREYIKKYLDRFPNVGTYLAASLEEARENGVTRTLFGRIRPVPELQSRNGAVRQQAERIGVNSPLQGSAADLIKVAMIRIQERLSQEGLEAAMIMQVHDELVFEVSPRHEQVVAFLVKQEMEKACQLSVPLVVDLSTGENWADAERFLVKQEEVS